MVLEMYDKNFKYLPWLESIEVARRNKRHFRLYVQKWGKFEPLYLGNELTFSKIKNALYFRVLGMYEKNSKLFHKAKI